jgi:DNA-binding NarL/FixJ family response regulator
MPPSASRPDNGVAVTSNTTKVLIADAHAPARNGVRRCLEGYEFTIVGEATDADGAVELALQTKPDLCLLEVMLPGDGVRAARELSARLPKTVVVMLTASESEEDFFDSLHAGAAGYLLKDLDPSRLPHALLGVLAGESAVPRRLVTRLMDEFRSQSRRRRVPLRGRRGPEVTAREWEVLELLRDGLKTAEIAARLHVSPVTVRRHLSAVTRKLNVPDRAAALRLLDATG